MALANRPKAEHNRILLQARFEVIDVSSFPWKIESFGAFE
jgi:hypothetical protein